MEPSRHGHTGSVSPTRRPTLRAVLISAAALVAVVGLGAAGVVGLSSDDAEPSSQEDPTPTVTPLPDDVVADYQLGGAFPPEDDVNVVIRDREAPSVPGLYNICYINVLQTQPDTLQWWEENHPDLLLRDEDGELIHDPNWVQEVVLDIRGPERKQELGQLLNDWFAQCAADGYQAIEADNLDAFGRSGDRVTLADAEQLAAMMVDSAHANGLAIAQKNTLEIDGKALGFDFAIAEECQVYDTCQLTLDSYGNQIIQVEYTDNGVEAFEQACAERAGQHSIQLRDRNLLPPSDPRHVSRRC